MPTGSLRRCTVSRVLQPQLELVLELLFPRRAAAAATPAATRAACLGHPNRRECDKRALLPAVCKYSRELHGLKCQYCRGKLKFDRFCEIHDYLGQLNSAISFFQKKQKHSDALQNDINAILFDKKAWFWRHRFTVKVLFLFFEKNENTPLSCPK